MATRSDRFEELLRRSHARRGIAIVGVCNVTPDSFSDGGDFFSVEAACERVDALVEEGADMVDVGAESTRPGARPVPANEQIARAFDVIKHAAGKVAVSIDTTSPEVAAACLSAGAIAVNDVSCLADAELATVVARAGAALVMMHSRGPQEKMRGFSDYPDSGYGDAVADVLGEWKNAAERANGRGVPMSSLVMDPGLGFSKNALQSADLLRRTGELVRSAGVPVMIGASRKSFLTVVEPSAEPRARVGASLAAAVHARLAGARLVRVHDVQATRQAIDMSLLLGTGEARRV